MNNKLLLPIAAAMLLSSCGNQQTSQKTDPIWLPKMFSDGMVIQQQSDAPIWGTATPNQKVTVLASWGESAETTADSNGNWKTSLKTPQYGGPHNICIVCGDTVKIANVLAGEVWLASGQSNMEMPMEGWLPECPVENGPDDIANSANDNIRIFMTERAVSFTPEKDVKGSWKAASPNNTPKFGATCYYFARKINKELGIPVGIINTSWGGTPDESWIPQEFIKDVPEYTEKVKLIQQSINTTIDSKSWTDKLPKVQKGDKSYDEIDLKDLQVAAKDFDDSNWKEMDLPRQFETDNNVRTFDGIVWFRKKIEIPASMAGKDITLSLGAIDDMDRTYLDGTLIGSTMQEGKWQEERLYTIPAAQATAGEHIIAVRVLDTQGGGGLCGKKENLKFYVKGAEKNAVSLVGNWKYLPTAYLVNGVFSLYDIPSQQFYQRPLLPIDLGEMTPTTLYNAMVAPFAGYKIAGAIWYQGEANVGRAEEYSRTFPLMIKSWREKWQQGNFPFYFVQIAPWNYGEGPSHEIREAQRLTLDKVENTDMAVTMDIGDNDNIHPANKHEVGDRLAYIALKNVYGKNCDFSGPKFKSQKQEGSKIILSFDYSNGLKTLNGKNPTGFEICGENGKYYNATAVIKGETIEVSAPEVKKPVSVRYLWKNCVNDNQIFNNSNLPSSSFQSTKFF